MKPIIASLVSVVMLVSSVCFGETLEEFFYSESIKEKEVKELVFGPSISIAEPIKPANELDCGVIVQVGKKTPDINALCSEVLAQYKEKFPNFFGKINVPVSFLPKKVITAKFGHRVEGYSEFVKIDGFTDFRAGSPIHFYVLSDKVRTSKDFFHFKTVFAHELFHVLTAWNHQKYEDEEWEAERFTLSLGLGI